MLLSLLVQVALSALLVSALTPTPTRRAITGPLPASQFVTTKDTQFFFNGKRLEFVGTNAYWLPVLNSFWDIDATLASIASAGISVVRVWAFNDVLTIPVNGTWFQLIGDGGTTTINNGPNGLQKLDTVVQLAEKHGLFLQLALTNNWNPFANNTAPSNSPRNTLSNDYGGMDTYSQAFTNSITFTHDEFYTNTAILNAFMNYTTQIVSRYINSPAVFGWELANDPRCNSSFPASWQCNTNTITRWHSQVAWHVRSIDPNHLISSGNNGDFCVDCPKLFPRAPVVSPSVQRRSAKPMTKKRLLEERRAAWKRSADEIRKLSLQGPRIRGRWHAPETKRQFDQGVGPSFDGSSGVDTEDILNIPQIGYGTFQLFPDQNNYGPPDPNLPAFNSTVQVGLSWIQNHADLAQVFNKPVYLTAFGLVTQNNAAVFVPFNSTLPPFGNTTAMWRRQSSNQTFGVTDSQRDDAYAQYLNATLQPGLGGGNQYQISQGNLTVQGMGPIQPTPCQTSCQSQSPTPSTGQSPNDGYALAGADQASALATISQAASAASQAATQGV